MNKKSFLFALSMFSLFLCLDRARAEPIDYFGFAVSNATGPAGSSTVYGSLSVPVLDTGQFGLFGFQTFSFNWNSHQYDASNTHLVGLYLDSVGNVSTAIFGNNCQFDFCSQAPGQNQWFAYFVAGIPSAQFLEYSSASDSTNYWSANFSIWRVAAPVPEPASIALMTVCVGILIFSRVSHRTRKTFRS